MNYLTSNIAHTKLRFFWLYLLVFLAHAGFTQITGKVMDEKGNPLAFATIYIEGTTKGVVANEQGVYEIEPAQTGTLTLVCQYLGYSKMQSRIHYKGVKIVHNFEMTPDLNLIGEVIIAADREDPAYSIIRNAIRKRNYYKNLVKSYETDLYIKGNIKVLKAPDQLLGSKVGNMDGVLDSTGQGILYLSESRSKFYFMAPDKKKEVMYASVSSGNENIFRPNQFSLAGFDFYNNYVNFGRSLISPIADNALDFYDYRLEQASVDADGRLVNKILIKPKSRSKPLVNGYIYITDGLWNIHSLDVYFTGDALKNTFPDTLRIQQIFVPVQAPDVWRLITQHLSFSAGLLGFRMGGNFSYIFSDYVVNHDVSHMFRDPERFRVDENALRTDSLFWQAKRPIPLTEEEIEDYRKKDSLKVVWKSKSFLDSMDRADNKLKWADLLTGYTWNNSYRNISFAYPSPMSTVRFNAVEGWKLNIDTRFQWSDSTYRRVVINPVVEYGFADKIIKPRLSVNYRYNNIMLGNVGLQIGRQYIQFDRNSPITERNTTWNSLFYKINRIRIYRQEKVEATWQHEIINGLLVNLNSAYVVRNPLQVNTHYSIFDRERLFDENIPRRDLDPKVYAQNSYFIHSMRLRWRPGQQYSSYPGYRFRRNGAWPEITLHYEKGLSQTAGFNDFDKIQLIVKDNYVNANLWGYFQYNLEYGVFPGQRPDYFADFFHPSANELLFPIDPGFTVFNLMPYYSYSTDRYYLSGHFRHHFNGYIFDRIPLINKTRFKENAGLAILYQPALGLYTELTIGLENFRIGPVPLFTIDYTLAFDRGGFRDHGIVFKLSSVLNN